MTSPRDLALEAVILADPDDPAGYLVYADALQAAGDPRGELIAVQAALVADPTSEALRLAERALKDAHRDAFGDDEVEHCQVDWFCGFWRGLYLGANLSTDPLDDLAAQQLASPSAKFLRVLSCVGPFSPRVLELAAPRAATLRSLDVGLLPRDTFTAETLRALAPLTQLRRLVLRSCSAVSDDGFAVLGGLRALEVLELNHCALSDTLTRAIGHLPLSEVTLTGWLGDVSADGMRALAAAPLRRFRLAHEGVDDALIAPLAAHPTLSNFTLYNAQLTSTGLAALGSVPQLRRLKLGSCSFREPDFAPLAPLAPGLASFDLGHSDDVGDLACTTLAAFKQLAFLDVSATSITGAGLRALSTLPSLTHLDLGFLRLDDADLAVLPELTNLRSLSLAYTRLTDRVIDTLLRMPRLEQLDLSGTAISASALGRLTALPTLTEVGLSSCNHDAQRRAYAHAGWIAQVREIIRLEDQFDD